jgi:nucleotide-binding universal stress UspA family protein
LAHVSHKLSNAFEGALAGGGDPATSPLYVFGPFLKLIVVAGVAQVTFGASVWLVVLTIAVVSTMYRLVMRWVTDGSGGSGLSEEEFGGWAVKVNAAITFIEYTLTFLVSMAAMVTFIADRIPLLNHKILWFQYRTIVAIALSLLTGWLVNRGPKMAARAFGPATAGVLLLLWVMVFATIIKTGFHLPVIDWNAFSANNLKFTLGGYVHILAVMTGIEVFANLVAAYEGTPAEKSKRAFQSLIIVMGTTAVTMLVVGPAIKDLADPTNEHVSVFTQTMDRLLPAPLPLVGTMIGIVVLMSASAASAQGLQNLALGLKERHYVPPSIGQPNRFGVADKPVWIEVGIVAVCFLFIGTSEETYLALYAAGVFILLSMTGWAVTKRLLREARQARTFSDLALMSGTVLGALLTTGATAIIFEERLLEGAWTYFVFIPLLYSVFAYFRKRIGDPSPAMDYLGQLDAAMLAGFGFGQAALTKAAPANGDKGPGGLTWLPEPIEQSRWRSQEVAFKRVAVLLDGSAYADQAIPMTKLVCQATQAHLTLLSAVRNPTDALKIEFETASRVREAHLEEVAKQFRADGIEVDYLVRPGHIADVTRDLVQEKGIDLVITTIRGKSGVTHLLSGGMSSKLISEISSPLLLVQSTGVKDGEAPVMRRILVALDGSIISERALPFARALAKAFDSELVLMTVPAVPEMSNYRAAAEAVDAIRAEAEVSIRHFLDAVARSLREEGLKVRIMVTGTMPARTIVSISESEDVDMIMLTSHGRGGLDLLFAGSVAQRVVQSTRNPVFMVPIREGLS